MVGNTITKTVGLDPKCKYREYCYPLYGECLDYCYVIKELLSGNTPEFLDSISTNIESSTPKIKSNCPRSINNVPIVGNCIYKDCPYHNDSVSFSCLKIHSDIFCKVDNLNILDNILHIDRRHIDTILKNSIYCMRMYTVMLRYLIEHGYKGEVKTEYLLLEDSLLYVGVVEYSTKLTKEQNFFSKKWVKMLKKPRYSNIPYVDLSYKAFFTEYSNSNSPYRDKLKLLRSMLSKIQIGDYNLSDIPLAYVVKAYYLMFGHINVDNFGLSDYNGKKMIQLFL